LPPGERKADHLLGLPVREWPFDRLTPPDVLEICKNVEARGSLDAARDLRSRISMIYQREIALGRCSVDPTGSVVALLSKPRRTNHATITYAQLPDFFCRLDAEPLVATTSLGLEAVIATWLRSTELRLARWVWLNREARELVIPSKAMKNGDLGEGDQIVPLSDYAMDVFDRLYAVTGHGELMFPHRSKPGEPISDGTWLNALYRMGYRNKATVHGIRALGSTTANEAHVTVPHVPVPVKMWESRWIDRQLDHVDSTVSGVYNRAEYMEPRRSLMQWWCQKVQDARASAKTLPLPPAKQSKRAKTPVWSADI
jgi:integrase